MSAEYSNDICADRIEKMLRAAGANSHAGLVLREYHDRRIAELKAAIRDLKREHDNPAPDYVYRAELRRRLFNLVD